MAVDKLVDSALLDAALGDIADVIRSKTGISGSFDFPTPNDIAEAIDFNLLMPTGTKTITENGTDIDVAQYSKVDVNVSGGGGGVATGSFTVAESATSYTIDTGGYYDNFVLFGTRNTQGSTRNFRFALTYMSGNDVIVYMASTNNSGSSVAQEINWITGGITRSGTSYVYNRSNVRLIPNIDYKWFAW